MKSLLTFYFALSKRLHRFRRLIWLLAAIAIIVFVAAIFLTKGPESTYYTLGSAIILVWMIILNAIISGFSAPMQSISPNDGLISKIRIRASNGFRWFLVLFTTIVLITTVVFTFRAFGILTSVSS